MTAPQVDSPRPSPERARRPWRSRRWSADTGRGSLQTRSTRHHRLVARQRPMVCSSCVRASRLRVRKDIAQPVFCSPPRMLGISGSVPDRLRVILLTWWRVCREAIPPRSSGSDADREGQKNLSGLRQTKWELTSTGCAASRSPGSWGPPASTSSPGLRGAGAVLVTS
jgi:hypothetical protein